MDGNEAHVIDTLVAKTDAHARLAALTSALQNIVNEADCYAIKRSHMTEGTISTREIRELFGWEMCKEAQEIINQREGKDA